MGRTSDATRERRREALERAALRRAARAQRNAAEDERQRREVARERDWAAAMAADWQRRKGERWRRREPAMAGLGVQSGRGPGAVAERSAAERGGP